ncbi:hypothetical protein Scani_32980 [Streptomyces caniferus]|uniref:Uncharacterized protein n=1 Tax=Streptomyces caniferus TaxID=285557 RepID=A0A640S767_9ACTN|nr:hypothetical protein Scani_32980 [Streptomyces caniferus]
MPARYGGERVGEGCAVQECGPVTTDAVPGHRYQASAPRGGADISGQRDVRAGQAAVRSARSGAGSVWAAVRGA